MSTKTTTLAVTVSCVMLTACATGPKSGNDNAAITILTPDVVSVTDSPNIEGIHSATNSVANSATNSAKNFTNSVISSDSLTLDEESKNKFTELLVAKEMVMVENDQNMISSSGNLWNRVRQGYAIEQSKIFNDRVEIQKVGFMANQNYFDGLTARTSHYLYHTIREAEARGLPTELALLPIIESSYDPTKNSDFDASGLWQFIPEMGKSFGLKQTEDYDGRKDVIASTTAAYNYLIELYNIFGQWDLALAAYNSNPIVVQEAIDNNMQAGLSTNFWDLELPRETMNYVPRFFAISQIIADPQKHGINLPAIADNQHFTPVTVRSGVSLNNVANVTNVALEELKNLNPSLLSGRVEAYAPQRIIVPSVVSADKITKMKNLYGDGIDSSVSQDGLTPKTASNEKSVEPFENNQDATVYSPPAGADSESVNSQKTDSIVTNPVVTNPVVTNPVAANPVVTNPVVTNPVVTNPVVTNPVVTNPVVTNPVVTNPVVTNPVAANPVATNPIVTKTDIGKTYVVQDGDALKDIATRAGVRWQDIIEWNQLDANGSLYVGMSLYLYDINKEPLPITKKATVRPDHYIVSAGNTLSGTANKFGLTTKQLRSYNGFDSNHVLKIGDKVSLIPSNKKNTPKKAVVSSSKTNSSKKSSDKSSKTLSGKVGDKYYVSSGDGLLSVANTLKVTTQALATANGINVNDGLIIGQVLKIPNKSKTTKSNKSKPKSSVNTASNKKPNAQLTTYKVKSGDTLLGVANRQGVKAGDLAVANDLSITSKLAIGDVLVIPANAHKKSKPSNPSTKSKASDVSKEQAQANSPKKGAKKSQAGSSYSVISYRVQSGDTLSTLAERYQVGLSTLARMNGMTGSSIIKVGQNIKVPVDFDAIEFYTVRSGDSLSVLANRYAITLPKLSGMNGLPADSQLKIGQVVKVPSR